MVTVDGAEGSVAWEVDVGTTVVAMYILQKDGLHQLPYTVVGKETLEEFAKVRFIYCLRLLSRLFFIGLNLMMLLAGFSCPDTELITGTCHWYWITGTGLLVPV